MPYRRYADFNGRSRRMEYWMFTLLQVIVGVILVLLIFGGVPTEAWSNPDAVAATMAQPGALFWIGGAIGLVWWLGSLVPSLAVTIRRLHDRDMSGWWYLGLIAVQFVPLVNWLASLAFLVLMFLPGTAGPNRFGLDPKDPSQAGVFA